MNDSWSLFKALGYTFKGVSPATLDYIAVLDILKGCASGMSNYNIASLMGLTEKEVVEVLESFLEYSGNEDDLPYNSYAVFLDYAGSYEHFIKALLEIADKEELDRMYKICYNVDAIEKEVDSYYADN